MFRAAAETFRNWHGNISRRVRVERPSNLTDLAALIRGAEARGDRIGVIGSGWSYSACVTSAASPPELLVATERLGSQAGGGDAIEREVDSFQIKQVLPAALQSQPVRILTAPGLVASDPFVHVLAGVKLSGLSWLLDSLGLAMPTLGGSNGQSLAGAVATATHGTNPGLPPIQDFVRAVHLMTSGGRQYWIEPARAPVTRADAMEALKRSGTLDAGLTVLYDDDCFDAVLVSLGAAGVWISVVLEAAAKHDLITETRALSLEEAAAQIAELAGGAASPFFAEWVFGSGQTVRYTERASAVPDAAQRTQPTDRLASARYGRILGLGWQLLVLLPFAALRMLVAALRPPAREARQARQPWLPALTVALINALWSTRLGPLRGPALIRQVHELIVDSLRPIGTQRERSFTIYNGQSGPEPMQHGPFERLIESREYAMDGADVMDFLTRLRALATADGADALLVTLNVRFTRGSRAALGMQQFDTTGYVEIWTVAGLRGNGRFVQQLAALVHGLPYVVLPHWGHLLDASPDGLAAKYARIASWRAQIRRLQDGQPTFQHAFLSSHGIL